MPPGQLLSGACFTQSRRAGGPPRPRALIGLSARWREAVERALGSTQRAARAGAREPVPPASRQKRPGEPGGAAAGRGSEIESPMASAPSAPKLAAPAEMLAPFASRDVSGEELLPAGTGSPTSSDPPAEPAAHSASASPTTALAPRAAERPAARPIPPAGPPHGPAYRPVGAQANPPPGGAEVRSAPRPVAAVRLRKETPGSRLQPDRFGSEEIPLAGAEAAGAYPVATVHGPRAERLTHRSEETTAAGSEGRSGSAAPARTRAGSTERRAPLGAEAGAGGIARDIARMPPDKSPAADLPREHAESAPGRIQRSPAAEPGPAEIHPGSVSFSRPCSTCPAPAVPGPGPAPVGTGPQGPGPPPAEPPPLEPVAVGQPTAASTVARPRPADPPRERQADRPAATVTCALEAAAAAAADRAGQTSLASHAVRSPADVAASVETVRLETIAQAILARARPLLASGSIELRFRLLPEDLGPVSVRLESRGRRIRVEIAASTDNALDALSAQAGRLGDALERLGFRDPQVRVGLELGWRRENAAGGEGRGGNHPPPPTERRDGTRPPQPSSRAAGRVPRAGQLDITI